MTTTINIFVPHFIPLHSEVVYSRNLLENNSVTNHWTHT